MVTLHGNGIEAAEGGHVVIKLGRFARATVLLVHDGSATYGQVVEIVLEDGAEATVTTIQNWADDTVHLAQHAAKIGRDATLKHVVVTFGGDVVRINAGVEYAAPGGTAEMLGSTSSTPVSTSSTGCSSTTTSRRPGPTWTTAAPCRARVRTRSGSATC